MNRIFENPFTWLFIAFGIFFTMLVYMDGKKDIAKEETKQTQIQYQYQWKMDSLKVSKQ
jgi:hypothetical protein